MQTTEDDWKKKLTPEQFHVMRQKGTEPPFSGKLLANKQTGDYSCAACGAVIFKSNAKYESTVPGLIGWPSFSEVASSNAVDLVPDNSWGMDRTEVVCKNCGGHLGHVFDADDSPTGKHYCVNSCSLDFKPQSK